MDAEGVRNLDHCREGRGDPITECVNRGDDSGTRLLIDPETETWNGFAQPLVLLSLAIDWCEEMVAFPHMTFAWRLEEDTIGVFSDQEVGSRTRS